MDYGYSFLSLQMKRTDTMMLTLPSDISLDIQGQFSFELWCLVSDLNTQKTILSQNGGIEFGIEDDKIYFASGNDILKTDSVLLKGIWNHIAVSVYQGNVRIFLNGNTEGEKDFQPAHTVENNSWDIICGNQFFGYIRYMRFYSAALITDDIRKLMYSENYPSTLSAYYDFSCVPPVEHKQGTIITLPEEAKIVKTMPAAEFKNYSFLRCVEPEINPGRVNGLPFTIQAWINFSPSDNQDNYVIFSNEDLIHDTGIEWGVCHKSDGYHLKLLYGALSQKKAVEMSRIITCNEWVNVAVTYEKNKISLFQDGVMENFEVSENFDGEWTNPKILIGAASFAIDDSGTSWFSGMISRLDVWKCVLTEDDVRKYAGDVPDGAVENLSASWVLWQSDMANCVSGVPLGHNNGIDVKYKNVEADSNDKEIRHKIFCEVSPLPLEELKKAREQSGIDVLADSNDENIAKYGILSSYCYENYVYFIKHTRDESCVLTRIEDNNDEYVVWCIELVLILLESLISWFLSYKVTYSSRLATYIRRTVLNARNTQTLFSAIGAGWTINTGMLINTFYEWIKKGFLTNMILMALADFSYWTVVTFIVGLARRFIGGVAGLAVWLGNIVLRLGIHIKKYPKKVPELQLLSVLFCHEEAGKICSIRVRKNDKEKWILPEWKSDRDDKEQAPAVYRLKRFSDTADCLEIRATIRFAYAKGKTFNIRADGGNVFGVSETVTIAVTTDEIHEETIFFKFPKQSISKKGIEKYDLELSWEYQTQGQQTQDKNDLGEFIRFCLSKHRIYTIFDSVLSPWGRTESVVAEADGVQFKTLYPWTDLYEVINPVLAGIMTPNSAKQKIENYIYTCGKFEYESASVPIVIKTVQGEKIGGFMLFNGYEEYLDFGDTSTKLPINCGGCAGVLVALANMYGCNFSMLRLGDNFKVNLVWLIGETEARLPEGTSGDGYFDFHVIAIDDVDISDQRNIHCYDSCMQFRDAGDSANPWIFAHGLPLSAYNTGSIIKTPQVSGTYLESVCENSGEGVLKCNAEWKCKLYFCSI